MLKKKLIEYRDENTRLEGYYVYDDALPGKRPAVLVAHDWSGRNEFSCEQARKLAELGYVGFALDMFGKGIQGNTNEEKMGLITPFIADRVALTQRIVSALDTLKKLDRVDTDRLGAIGFCFGGLCVLDLARSGAKVNGVVSFHGLLNSKPSPACSIHAKVLVLHGHEDPMVKPEQVLEFENEMTLNGVDWQLHAYGKALHGFTNPLANNPALGLAYDPTVARRAWIAMENFFTEIF